MDKPRYLGPVWEGEEPKSGTEARDVWVARSGADALVNEYEVAKAAIQRKLDEGLIGRAGYQQEMVALGDALTKRLANFVATVNNHERGLHEKRGKLAGSLFKRDPTDLRAGLFDLQQLIDFRDLGNAEKLEQINSAIADHDFEFLGLLATSPPRLTKVDPRFRERAEQALFEGRYPAEYTQIQMHGRNLQATREALERARGYIQDDSGLAALERKRRERERCPISMDEESIRQRLRRVGDGEEKS